MKKADMKKVKEQRTKVSLERILDAILEALEDINRRLEKVENEH